MRIRFDRFEIDTEQFTLRGSDGPIHVEPLVFDLIAFLTARAGQVVSREAIIEHVWKGRIVSDATVASCIKSARRALGDDGQSQTLIRTVRGRGFQLAAMVEAMPAPDPASVTSAGGPRFPEAGEPGLVSAPPRIAVLPLTPLGPDAELGLFGDALSQEVILELSRLHWLFVIARGSSFKFRGQGDLDQVATTLGAGYLVTGTILRQGDTCEIAVELCRFPEGTVVWAERFGTRRDAIMHMRSTLAVEIVGALEPRIQLAEAMQAAKVPTEQLDAWSAYHRGLAHMFRFNRRDNEMAAGLFARSIRLDPDFARAHAALSFTHFQDAFLRFSPDVAGAVAQARACAVRSMELDPLDPFVNLTMGRAEWLGGSIEASLPWMERSISLSPNYALAIYNSALVGALLGEGAGSEARVAKAISLSPIDPLNYAMLATRALSHVVRSDPAMAALWAERAIRSPNAHVQIYAIAAFTNEMIGKYEAAVQHVEQIRLRQPGYARADFLRWFPFRHEPARRGIERSLQRLGL